MSEETNLEKRPRMGTLWSLLIMAGVIGLFGYFCNQSDWICAGATLAIGFAAFGGFRTGAVKALGILAAGAATFYLAPLLGMQLESTFSDWVGTSGIANRIYSIIATGVLVFLLTAIMTIKLGNSLLKDRPKLFLLNHWLGFLIGGFEGVLVVLLLLGGMVSIQKVNAERLRERIPPTGRAKLLTDILDKTSENTKASQLGPTVDQFNPFERVPQLSKVGEWQRGMEVLMDPSKVNALFQQPAIKQLRTRDDVNQAFVKLNEDPEIQKLLNSNKPASKELAVLLLNHPAVLELVDQPEFREAALSAFRETVMPPNRSSTNP